MPKKEQNILTQILWLVDNFPTFFFEVPLEASGDYKSIIYKNWKGSQGIKEKTTFLDKQKNTYNTSISLETFKTSANI